MQKYDFQKLCLGCEFYVFVCLLQVEEDEFDETREEDQLAATQEREDHEMTGSDFSDAESTQDEEEGEEGAEEESEGTEAEEDEETDYLEVSIVSTFRVCAHVRICMILYRQIEMEGKGWRQRWGV